MLTDFYISGVGVTRQQHTLPPAYSFFLLGEVGHLGLRGRVTLKFACSANISKLEISSFAISKYTKCFDLWELPSQTPEWEWHVCLGQPLLSPDPQ